jgi:hypothetical protein
VNYQDALLVDKQRLVLYLNSPQQTPKMQHEVANLAVFVAGLVQDAGQCSALCGAFLFVQWAKSLLLIGS